MRVLKIIGLVAAVSIASCRDDQPVVPLTPSAESNLTARSATQVLPPSAAVDPAEAALMARIAARFAPSDAAVILDALKPVAGAVQVTIDDPATQSMIDSIFVLRAKAARRAVAVSRSRGVR